MDLEADAEEVVRLLGQAGRPLVRRTLLDLLDALRASLVESQLLATRRFEGRAGLDVGQLGGLGASRAASSAGKWPAGGLAELLPAGDLAMHRLRPASSQLPDLSSWLSAGGASSSGGWQGGGRHPGELQAGLHAGRSLSQGYLPLAASAAPQLRAADLGSLPDLSQLALGPHSAHADAQAAAVKRQLLQALGLGAGPLGEEPQRLGSSAAADARQLPGVLPGLPVLPGPCGSGELGEQQLCQLTTCSWEQAGQTVRIYVPLRGVQTAQIQASFQPTSVEVRVLNLKGKSYVFSIPRTCGPIEPDASLAMASKTRKNILITLQKQRGEGEEELHWADLHWIPEEA